MLNLKEKNPLLEFRGEEMKNVFFGNAYFDSVIVCVRTTNRSPSLAEMRQT